MVNRGDERKVVAALAEALDGCSAEEARRMLWETAEILEIDPTELLGLDVDNQWLDDSAAR